MAVIGLSVHACVMSLIRQMADSMQSLCYQVVNAFMQICEIAMNSQVKSKSGQLEPSKKCCNLGVPSVHLQFILL